VRPDLQVFEGLVSTYWVSNQFGRRRLVDDQSSRNKGKSRHEPRQAVLSSSLVVVVGFVPVIVIIRSRIKRVSSLELGVKLVLSEVKLAFDGIEVSIR
jgi:hypothetical protein